MSVLFGMGFPFDDSAQANARAPSRGTRKLVRVIFGYSLRASPESPLIVPYSHHIRPTVLSLRGTPASCKQAANICRHGALGVGKSRSRIKTDMEQVEVIGG
ncbi:hypothetical protein, partial [Thioclava indica]|uniref:hypothetical protein n=1 Tax=Thioclava indica TaxID=1353528 RepID=UPI001969F3EC